MVIFGWAWVSRWLRVFILITFYRASTLLGENPNNIFWLYSELQLTENCYQLKDNSFLLILSGQKEKKFKDGKKEIACANGTLVTTFPDGREEILYTDNSKIITTNEGEKILVLPNGQREFHTKDHKVSMMSPFLKLLTTCIYSEIISSVFQVFSFIVFL